MANRELPRAAALANIQGSSGTSPISYLAPLGKAGAPQVPDPVQMPGKPMAQPWLNDEIKSLSNLSTSLQKAVTATLTMDARIAAKRKTGTSSDSLKNIGPHLALQLISDDNYLKDQQAIARLSRQIGIPILTQAHKEEVSFGLGRKAAEAVFTDINTPANVGMWTSLNSEENLDEVFELHRQANKFGSTAAQNGFDGRFYELANAFKIQINNERDVKIQAASIDTTMNTLRQTIRINNGQLNTDRPLDESALGMLQPIFQAFATTKSFVNKPINEILIPSVMQAVGTIAETHGVEVAENALKQIMEVKMANNAPWAAPNTKKGDMVVEQFEDLMESWNKKEELKGKINKSRDELTAMEIDQHVAEGFLATKGTIPLTVAEIGEIQAGLEERFPGSAELIAKAINTLHDRNQNLTESVTTEEQRESTAALNEYTTDLYNGTFPSENFFNKVANDTRLRGSDKTTINNLMIQFSNIEGYATKPSVRPLFTAIDDLAKNYKSTTRRVLGVEVPDQTVDPVKFNKLVAKYNTELGQIIFETINEGATPVNFKKFGERALTEKDDTGQSVIDRITTKVTNLLDRFNKEVNSEGAGIITKHDAAEEMVEFMRNMETLGVDVQALLEGAN